MLRYTTLGSKIIFGLSLALAGLALYLPFLEAFALTPAIAFIHRFSITLNLGADTKTVQPIIFVIPILLLKGVWEYHKRYEILSLFKTKLALVLLLLVLADAVSLLTSTDAKSSFSVLIVHGINMAIFVTASIWLHLVSDLLTRPAVQKIGISLIRTLSITLAIFTIVNALVSVSQFVDCSFSANGCRIWSTIDQTFPNKLLAVGWQKFSDKPLVARTPGFFGDVNFNGMFSLFVVFGSGVLWGLAEILKTAKGYVLSKEQRYLIVVIIAGLVSYLTTLSRSALLGAGVVGIVALVLMILPVLRASGTIGIFSKKIARIVAYGTITTIVLFFVGYQVPLSHDGQKTSISGEIGRYVQGMFSPEQSSTRGHASLFTSAIKIGNQNPLYGMGMGTFGVQYEKLIRPGKGTDASPHSTYGLLYAEQGLLGLFLYSGVIIMLWISAVAQAKSLIAELLADKKNSKKFTREQFLLWGSRLMIVLVAFGIPFFSVATVSYYGFFLPMTWWWGSAELLKH